MSLGSSVRGSPSTDGADGESPVPRSTVALLDHSLLQCIVAIIAFVSLRLFILTRCIHAKILFTVAVDRFIFNVTFVCSYLWSFEKIYTIIFFIFL